MKRERDHEQDCREAGVEVIKGERLDLKNGVTKENGRITAIRMVSGKTFAGKMFVDATYEGDLMAAAGVSWTIGREGRKEFGESFARFSTVG